MKFRDIEIQEITSLSHYYREMTEDERSFLLLEPDQEDYDIKEHDHVFEDSRQRGYISVHIDEVNQKGIITGFYVKPEYRKSGIAYTLGIIMAFYLFDICNLRKIETGAHGANPDAHKIYNRFLVLEGILRRSNLFHGKEYDRPMYGLMKEEFEERFGKYRKFFSKGDK